ncbi:glycosyl transferase [bacterium]|nr:glycosyl transferase [bacterium]
MDTLSFDLIKKINRSNLIPISVEELRSPEVDAVRARTTHGQFCWVSQPLICQYLLKKFDLEIITYLEADSLFFADPKPLFDELGAQSVSLVPHRYTPEYDQTEISGKYCVQFNAFRNNAEGQAVLDFWKSECFKYSKDFPLTYPGQTCLDEWPSRFPGVKELTHIGGGAAPWNIQQYSVTKKDSKIFVNNSELIFFHYHSMAKYEDGRYELGRYRLSRETIEFIYKPYLVEMEAAEKWVKTTQPDFNYCRTLSVPKNPIEKMRRWASDHKRKWKGNYNVYSRDRLTD